MGTFAASLRTIGDVKSLAATIELSEDSLRIVAGDTEIGNWALSEIQLEEVPTGYRMKAEGDQVLIELKDADSFTRELGSIKKDSQGFSLRRKKKEPKKKVSAAKSKRTDPPVEETPKREPTPSVASAVSTSDSAEPAPAPTDTSRKTPDKGNKPGAVARAMDAVDTIILKAKKRFGSYLPDFLFSRAMFFIGLSLLIVAAVTPVIFSNLLIAAGCLLILFGAVVYSDTVLASKWLPGRATPQHALLSGVGVLMVGVLLGLIAN